MTKQDLINIVTDNAKLPKDYKELGIFKFAKMFFPDRFKNEFALIHYKIIVLFFQLLDPDNKYDFERRRYLLIHRQAAKTTLTSFLFPIYNIYLKKYKIKVYKSMLKWDFKDINDVIADEIVEIELNENFIVIASETASQAQNFVLSLKSTIDEHPLLNKIFGEKSPEVIEITEQRKTRTKVWRTDAFITKDKTIVYGIGAGQRVRGRNIFGYRPSLFIVDDMYSQYNTKTEETRKKFDYWFKAEAMNSIDNNVGKLIWIGTMVHPDTVVKDFRVSELWKGLEQPIIAMEDLHMAINTFTNENNVFVMPTKEQCKELEKKINSFSWKDRHDLYSILTRYNEHYIDNTLNYFYQEYMNEPIAPEMLIIKQEHFIPINPRFYIKDGKQLIEFEYNKLKWLGEVYLNIGLDPASSTATNSDDTVIIVAGFIKAYPIGPGFNEQSYYNRYPNGFIAPIIAHIEAGKYSIYNYENLPGMVESIVKLVNRFKINYVNIETNAQQIQIAREVRKTFQQNNIRVAVYDEYSNQRKEDRIMTTILPILQYYKLIFYDNMYKHHLLKLYHQLIALGITDHDDYPDALSICLKNAVVPNYLPSSVVSKDSSSTISRWELLYQQYGEDAWMYY